MIVTTFDVLRAQYLLEIRTSEGMKEGRPFWGEADPNGGPWKTPLDKLPVLFRIIADTEGEALAAAASVSQSPPAGWGWRFRVTQVSQHIEPDEPAKDSFEYCKVDATCVLSDGHHGQHTNGVTSFA